MLKEKLYTIAIGFVLLGALVSATANAKMLVAEPIQPIDPITEVLPVQERDDFVLCGGSASGPSAYYQKSVDLSGRLTSIVDKKITQMEGGTVACARALANGTADAAILQDDLVPWLTQTKSPLLQNLGYGGAVMSEALMAFCGRNAASGNEEDFGNIGQKKKYTIAIAGNEGSGINLTLNAISGEDSGWKKPSYIYSGSWQSAFRAVQDGLATCAVGVSNPNGEQWEKLDDEFGKTLRMMEIKDSDFWDVKGFGNQQLYGELTINKKNEVFDDFLDWKGKKNRGTWSPEMPALNASVYYRVEAVPSEHQDAIAKAVSTMSDVMDLKR